MEMHLTSARMAILNNITIMADENDQRQIPLYRYGLEGSLFTLLVGMPMSADNMDISVEDYQKPKRWFTLWPTYISSAYIANRPSGLGIESA